MRKSCMRDWERMTAKEKFASALQREAKATGSAVSVGDQVKASGRSSLHVQPTFNLPV